MVDFKGYIACEGRGVEISIEELDMLLGRYEWFTLGRIVREHVAGRSDEVVRAVSACRGVSSLKVGAVDLSALRGFAPFTEDKTDSPAESSDEIIDRFLQERDLRIVADEESGDDVDVKTEAEFDDEDDLVSEELAEIYLSQGLKSEALQIYRKLSLLNTEKSVYFAEIIDKIEK